MRKFLLSLCLIVALGGVTEARISGETESVYTPTIIIVQSSGGGVVGNRGGAVVPISGYVDLNAQTVCLNFSRPCGLVQVSFTNLSNGGSYDAIIEGQDSVSIPIILSPGTWQVTFTLEDGTCYVGVFSIA